MTMIEKSPVFLEMLRHIEKMTRCDIPVLIEGETGAGKELVARTIRHSLLVALDAKDHSFR